MEVQQETEEITTMEIRVHSEAQAGWAMAPALQLVLDLAPQQPLKLVQLQSED
jgi:hypothetical protein